MLKKMEKIVSCERTSEEVLDEWSHQVRATYKTGVKVLLKRFHLNGNTTGFHPQTQKLELHTK